MIEVIPEDVWKMALEVAAVMNGQLTEKATFIARAILTERLAERERCGAVADEIGRSYGEDETGWFECSETIAAAIRRPS